MSPVYRQQPTLQNVRIRTAQDALQVFYAVARNTLTLLSRRLDSEERKSIRPGQMYVSRFSPRYKSSLGTPAMYGRIATLLHPKRPVLAWNGGMTTFISASRKR